MSELRKNIPAIALRGMTVLPGMIVHFDISRKKSIKAVEQSMMRDQKILLNFAERCGDRIPGRKRSVQNRYGRCHQTSCKDAKKYVSYPC